MTSGIASVALRGTWWRHAGAGADPWAQPEDPFDGRWQRGTVVEAIYLAESPATAWAEWYRYLAEAGMPPERGLPRDLWHWEVDIGGVADLRSPPALVEAGIGPLQPTRSQWPACQRVGEELFREGHGALIAPSAARPEQGQILCVYRTGARVSGLTPIPPPELHEHPPPLPLGLRT